VLCLFVCTWAQDERPADLHIAQPNVPVSKCVFACEGPEVHLTHHVVREAVCFEEQVCISCTGWSLSGDVGDGWSLVWMTMTVLGSVLSWK
jgi:hypothetical protein